MKRTQQQIDALIEELDRGHAFGGINPSERQLRDLLADDREGTVHYLNLLKFREKAEYPPGHELADAGLSGEHAYLRYGVLALAHVQKRGGFLPFLNRVEQVIIGKSERWDQVVVMQYPDREAFIDMIRDPEYQASLVHRDAGLKETTVLITTSLLPDAG